MIRRMLASWLCGEDQLWSLSLKLTLTMTSLVVAAIGSITMLSIQRERNNFRIELQNQADLVIDIIDVTVRDSLYNLDANRLADFMGSLGQRQPIVTSGYIYDPQGYLLADSTSQVPVFKTEIDPIGQRLVSSPTTRFEWQDQELLAGRAVIVGNDPIGAIRLGLSTEALQQKVVAVRNRGIAIAIVAALMSWLLAKWISRSITKPLEKLVQGSQRIAQGDFDQPIQVRTRDELAVLAKAFNVMGDQLQQTLGLLEQQNEDLETRVQQRTATLTQTLSELQETQTQLVQSEKMSSLGELVAGVAHEINNPVNFIHGNLQHLDQYVNELYELVQLYQTHYPEPHPEIEDMVEDIDLPFLEEDLAKVMDSMQIGTDRIREIVLSLRNFARTDEAAVKMVDIHEGIDSTLMILQHRLKASSQRPAIKITKDYGEIPEISCYPGQLNQVFMNILANAIDALEESNEGRAYPDLEADPNQIHIQTRQSHPQWLTIAIQDNGPGIPEAIRAKLFNPFFTTKSVGKGTGLGLSISYRIITEKHAGKIFCDSMPGQGTTFVIELPIQAQALDSAGPTSDASVHPALVSLA